MPQISTFYGISIWMYRPDHPPPHFHAQYAEHWARVDIGSLGVLEGELPRRALRMVRKWARLHTRELRDNWKRAQALEPLISIEPLP